MLLRESIRGYVAEGLARAGATGVPLVRPMVLAFEAADADCGSGSNSVVGSGESGGENNGGDDDDDDDYGNPYVLGRGSFSYKF